MSSKINLQTCEYARKSSIFQDNQLIYLKYLNTSPNYQECVRMAYDLGTSDYDKKMLFNILGVALPNF